MNDVLRLTEALAQKTLGWKSGPNRYLMSNRRWLPKWRFQPTEKIADAFHLVEAGGVEKYQILAERKNKYLVKVRTSRSTGQGCATSLPLAISLAVARAYGIDVDCLCEF